MTAEILIIDDDTKLSESLSRYLMAYSDMIFVTRAESATAALELLKNHSYDILLIDLYMPKINGMTFLRLINENDPSSYKIVWTGAPTRELKTTCQEMGANLFIGKPKSFDELEELARNIFHQTTTPRKTPSSKKLPLHTTSKPGLVSILQTLCDGDSSCVLDLIIRETEARIYIFAGSPLHATFGTEEGLPALQKIFQHDEFHYDLSMELSHTKQTLYGTWAELLSQIHDTSSQAVAWGKVRPFLDKIKAFEENPDEAEDPYKPSSDALKAEDIDSFVARWEKRRKIVLEERTKSTPTSPAPEDHETGVIRLNTL